MSDLQPVHPLIVGMVQILPPAGVIWPKEKRAQWIAAITSCLELLYNDEPVDRQQARAAVLATAEGGEGAGERG